MPVSTKHPTYRDAQRMRSRTQDAAAGQQRIKDKNTDYLPGFEPEDIQRYNDYKKRARFLNVTGRTREALVGAVYRRDPEIELPPQIEYLLENADGGGESLVQLAKRATEKLLDAGQYGILVDYPSAPEGMTEEEVAALELRAVFAPYRAESIINYRTAAIGGSIKLTMVVLQESRIIEVDEFEQKSEPQYRVLRLTDGVYTQTLYDKDGVQIGSVMVPRDFNGNQIDTIPFAYMGSKDNKPDPDEPPLYDLAETNISHYQVSADHMENLHIHGQLTLGISSELGVEEWKAANPAGVAVGARAGHFLGPGGSFTTATAPESSSLSKALDDLKADMIAIGGRLIQPRSGQMTAEQARIDASSETSVLQTLVGNQSEAFTKAIEFVCLFMGADPEAVTFSLNREFWDKMPDPQMLAAIMGLEQNSIISRSDMRDWLRRTGVVDPARTDEEIDEEIAQSGL